MILYLLINRGNKLICQPPKSPEGGLLMKLIFAIENNPFKSPFGGFRGLRLMDAYFNFQGWIK
jgi:hypothetical protein